MKALSALCFAVLLQFASYQPAFAAATRCLELGKLPTAPCKKTVGDLCMAFEGCVMNAAKTDNTCLQRHGQSAFQVAACKTCATAEAGINTSYDACMKTAAPAAAPAPTAAATGVPKSPAGCSPSPDDKLVAFDQAGSCSGTNCPCTFKPCPGSTPDSANPGWGKTTVPDGAGKPMFRYCTERSCKMTQPSQVTCFTPAS